MLSRNRSLWAVAVSAALLTGLAVSLLWGGPADGTSYSVEQRLAQFGAAARQRLQPHFEQAGVAWPGRRVALLAFKDSKQLELHAQGADGNWRFIRRYPILAASGDTGPKLREGDFQVPEGFYSVTFLNANSRFHVSLRLNYPNDFDKRMAVRDGRRQLGGDIMIHGSRVSVGCLAMGDPVAEELFTLTQALGMHRLEVLIAPTDFRHAALPDRTEPAWLLPLYRDLQDAMQRFPVAE